MPTGPKGEKRPADVIGNAVGAYGRRPACQYARTPRSGRRQEAR